jgi:3-deoxy-D-manno-octulosonate 8-phosphate phosphatase (KDO 8-P phosphatase)
MDNFKEKLKEIKAFVFDVDGVFSENIILDASGDMMRFMNVKDGFAVKTAIDKGFKIAIITGGFSQSVIKRFSDLGVKDIVINSKNKTNDYVGFCNKYGLQFNQILYMGDDIPDYEPMRMSGLAACPSDAAEEIQNISHYVSDKEGGKGCVRDIIEQVLRAQTLWYFNNGNNPA